MAKTLRIGSRDDFYQAVIAGLSQQLADLADSLARVPGDKLVGTLTQVAQSISVDLSSLIQACHVEREQDRIHGEITRANSDDQKTRLRAERSALPRVSWERPTRGRPVIVRPAAPATLRARDVGERLGISLDTVKLSMASLEIRSTERINSQ